MISQSCYVSKARRCPSIPHGNKFGTCPTAPNPGTSPMTMNCGDSSPQWAGAFRASDSAKPRVAVPKLREAVAVGNTLNVDVVQLLLDVSAGGYSVSDVCLPDVALANAPLPGARPNGSVHEEWNSPRVLVGAIVVVTGLGSGFCLVRFLSSNLFISGIEYYMRRKVFESLRVYCIYGFCIGFFLFIVLWNIMHAAIL